jgi:hypothetical protein
MAAQDFADHGAPLKKGQACDARVQSGEVARHWNIVQQGFTVRPELVEGLIQRFLKGGRGRATIGRFPGQKGWNSQGGPPRGGVACAMFIREDSLKSPFQLHRIASGSLAMTTCRFALLAALGWLVAPDLPAEPVYRCIQNGKIVFTDGPVDPSCQKVDLKVYQPDPAEVARLEEQKRIAAEQERAAQAQAEQDRLLQAQTQAAQAQARAANAQRQWVEQQTQDRQIQDALDGNFAPSYGYGYYGGYGYGYPYGYYGGAISGRPVPVPPLGTGQRPPFRPQGTPNYPYGADLMRPGR